MIALRPEMFAPLSDPQDLTNAVFGKTLLGQQEIQDRSLGLVPLVRRILVLADGKRSYEDLAALVPEGSDLGEMIRVLLEKGCLQVQSMVKSPASPSPRGAQSPEPSKAADPVVAGTATNAKSHPDWVPASQRTAKDNDMARHFMMNSVNAIIGQGLRISLIHDIFHSDTTEKLREVYFAWEASMSNHGMGARRLPELREKLFKVL
jgi:hypothetical protein